MALDEQHRFSIGSKILLRDFYVDDLMSEANSVEEALLAQNEIIQILQSGGLPIRKWTSNNEQILLNVSEDEREVSLPLNFDSENIVKTLGVYWNPATDKFSYRVTLTDHDTVTKRHFSIRDIKII